MASGQARDKARDETKNPASFQPMEFKPKDPADAETWWLAYLGCCGSGFTSNLCAPLCLENSKILCVYASAESGFTECLGERGCCASSQFCKCLCVQQTCSSGSGLYFCSNQSDCRLTEVGGENGIVKIECTGKELCVSSAMSCKLGEICGEYSLCLMNRKCLFCYVGGNFLPKSCFMEFFGIRCIGRPRSASSIGDSFRL